jgi:hypothetical protein
MKTDLILFVKNDHTKTNPHSDVIDLEIHTSIMQSLKLATIRVHSKFDGQY